MVQLFIKIEEVVIMTSYEEYRKGHQNGIMIGAEMGIQIEQKVYDMWYNDVYIKESEEEIKRIKDQQKRLGYISYAIETLGFDGFIKAVIVGGGKESDIPQILENGEMEDTVAGEVDYQVKSKRCIW